jgi:hypothetical protein
MNVIRPNFRLMSAVQRLGFFPPVGARTIWVHGEDSRDFDAVDELLGALRDRYPRLQLALTSNREQTRVRLGDRYPNALVLPTPFAVGVRRFFKRLNPRVVLLLGSPDPLAAPVVKRAEQRGIALVAIRTAPSDIGIDRMTELAAVERFLVRSDAEREELLRAGARNDRIAVIGATAAIRLPTDPILEELAPLLRRDLKALRHSRDGGWLSRTMDLVNSRAGQWLLAWRSTRIADLEELRRRLGDPETILCLGNGPSSEDSRLREIHFDVLFRVNWQWLRRGLLTEPDVVFTGDQQTVKNLRSPIFGIQTTETETRLLLTRILSPTAPRLEYVTLERLPLFLNEGRWDAKPTNGAAMLALAAALQPKRLIISGIDLFQHPAGSYPGDEQTVNAYTPRHDRDVEVQIIETALDGFRGEITILSEPLRLHLERRKSSQHETVPEDLPNVRASS